MQYMSEQTKCALHSSKVLASRVKRLRSLGSAPQDLGTVEWRRKSFHSETNIWPIGYRSVRYYASRRQPLGHPPPACWLLCMYIHAS